MPDAHEKIFALQNTLCLHETQQGLFDSECMLPPLETAFIHVSLA